MNKKTVAFLSAILLSNVLYAEKCSDGLKYDFTFYGAPDKSYVVTKNTFKKYESNFPDGKLLNATLSIDAFSLDTSADLNNKATKWPPAMATVRNNNTINRFFKLFDKDAGKIDAKIVKVADSEIGVSLIMNGVTKEISFAYEVQNDTIKAKGKLDILEFGVGNAWKSFETVCRGFHHGKSWSEIDIFFEVPASCK